MLIEVTQEDIDKGRPRTAGLCPIALAVNRVRPDVTYIRVGADSLSVAADVLKSIECRALPTEASEWIHCLDVLGKEFVAPFSFELEEEFAEVCW